MLKSNNSERFNNYLENIENVTCIFKESKS